MLAADPTTDRCAKASGSIKAGYVNTCTTLTGLVAASKVAGDDQEAAITAATEAVKEAQDAVDVTMETATPLGDWSTVGTLPEKDTKDTDTDKKDAEGDDKEASALNLVAGSATLLAVSTMMLQ